MTLTLIVLIVSWSLFLNLCLRLIYSQTCASRMKSYMIRFFFFRESLIGQLAIYSLAAFNSGEDWVCLQQRHCHAGPYPSTPLSLARALFIPNTTWAMLVPPLHPATTSNYWLSMWAEWGREFAVFILCAALSLVTLISNYELYVRCILDNAS